MPIWGAVPTKFALQAGLLVISARIDLHPIRAIIDPSQPVTIVGEKAAALLGVPYVPRTRHDVAADRDLGLDHTTRRLRQVVTDAVDGADIVIGADVLKRTPMVLDFAKHRFRVPATMHEALRLGRGLVPVAATQTADGCLTLAGRQAGSDVTAALPGGKGSAAGERPIQFGDVTISASPAPGRCAVSRLAIGWQDFNDRRVVLDLPADRILLER